MRSATRRRPTPRPTWSALPPRRRRKFATRRPPGTRRLRTGGNSRAAHDGSTRRGDGHEHRLLPSGLFIGLRLCARLAPPGARRRSSTTPIILVAKRQLQDQLYGSTIAARAADRRRSPRRLHHQQADAGARSASCSRRTSRRSKVADPVFLGGPVSPEVIFALVQGKDSPGGRSLKIARRPLPRDRQRRGRPRDREAAGAGALLRRHGAVAPGRARTRRSSAACGTCTTRAPTSCCASRPTGMWEELVGRSERKANAI